MNVLDELKSRLEDLAFAPRPGSGSTWKRAIGDALLAVEMFEQQHPGLIDCTVQCEVCGATDFTLPLCSLCVEEKNNDQPTRAFRGVF